MWQSSCHGLFDNRKLSPRTIQGYRSAIAVQLKAATGYDPGQDEFLSQLIKGFHFAKATS